MSDITARTPWASHMGDLPLHLDYFEGTMFEAVSLVAKKYPEQVALDFMGRSVTYRDLVRDIRRCAAALKAMGINKVFAITAGHNTRREALALELGADRIYSLSREGEEAITAALAAENDGLGVDLCFEASGAPAAVRQGMEILRNRGVYLIPGQYSASGGVEIQPQLITFKALHIIGSSQYSLPDVRDYLEFLLAHPELHGKIEKLANKYRIDDINAAFADAKAGTNIKTMLVK